MQEEGISIYALAEELFPICRSITGNGVRQTLNIIQRDLPEVKTYEVPSGEKVFDWTVPKEWNIKDAYVIDPDGNKIIDFQRSNLHVVGYSIPINETVSLNELQDHL
jgi:aminopeptidase-like protein